MKKKLLLTSILTVIMCFSLIVGATFALFTSESNIKISVNAANVQVDAVLMENSITTKSFDKVIKEGVSEGTFENGGTATFNEDKTGLTLDLLTPGDEASFTIDVTNKSTVSIKYRVEMYATGELAPALTAVAVIGENQLAVNGMTEWLSADANATIEDVIITVAFPDAENNNDYKGKSAEIQFAIIAVQANGAEKYVETNFKNAVAAGGVVKLNESVNLSSPLNIPAGTETTIDLNGNTITASEDGYAIKTEAGANVVIGDSSKASTFSLRNTVVSGVINGVIENVAGSTMTILNATAQVNTVNGSATIINKGDMIIDGATIIGAPIGETGYPAYAIQNSGNLTIEEGTSVSADRGCLFISGTGETVINGGSFVNNDIAEIQDPFTSHVVVVGYGANNKLTINGGTFEHRHETTSGGVVINNWSAVTVDVNGGSFSGGNYFGKWDNLSDYGYGSTKTPFAVKGGTFTGLDKNYVVTGYSVTENTDGTWTVSATQVGSSSELSSAIASGEAAKLTEDVQWNSTISNDATIDLAGNTFEATNTIKLSNNADLTMTGGDYEVNSTYGHVDVRPTTAEGSVLTFEDVNFSFNKLGKTYGPSTNRLGSVVEVCAEVTDAKTVVVFKNCTFDNAKVFFEGLSGTIGEFEATFENCTFNALTSSAPIEVKNYVKGTINVIGCTFNMEVTSSSASAICVSPSSSTAVTVKAENNTFNVVAATPYTYDASKGETEEYNVKVNGTPANIKFISISGTTSSATETNTTKTGIAAK